MENRYWFKRRRYGYGWIPSTWQGWTAIGLYVVVLLGGATMLADVPENEFTSEVGVFVLIFVLATAGLLRISYAKGPKPKWRWGAKPDDNPEEDF